MNPNPNIVSREINNKQLAEILAKFSFAVADCVNFGSNLIEWISNVGPMEAHNIVLIANLRFFLEQIDACSELLNLGVSEPCLAVMRATFECFINSAYIFQANHAQRARSYLYFQLLEQKQIIDKMDVKTDAAKQAKATIEKDDYLKMLDLAPPENIDALRKQLDEMMNIQAYAETKKEYERFRAKNPKTKPAWYSLFDGPRSFEQLASKTGCAGLYEFFYRYLSGFVHGTRILSKAIHSKGVRQLRLPFSAQFVCNFSLSMSFLLFQKYIDYYCKDKMKEYHEWYLSLREIYLYVTEEEIIRFDFKDSPIPSE